MFLGINLRVLGGAVIMAALVTLAAAAVSLGPTTDLTTWLRNLGLAEAGAIGGAVLAYFGIAKPLP